ncbi:hypothetical protein FDF08_09320 [Micrococcus luteus]|nr:hypothetical protein FDF08_09320 [Micrococcus luteus]
MLNTSLVLAAAEGPHVVNELPIPTVWYGIIVFALLMAALLATMSMRSRALRLPEPTTAVQHHGTGHGSHTPGH